MLSFIGMDLTTILIALVVIILVSYLRARSRGKLPPGPSGYPIVGCLPYMRTGQQTTMLGKLRKQYGDIFCLPLGQKWVIYLNGREAIREAYVKNGEIFSDRPDLFIFHMFQFKGILGSSGDYWKQTRTFSLHSLRDFGFGRRSLEGKILEEVKYYLTAFEVNGGRDIDVKERTFLSVSNVICNVVFGERFDIEDTKFLNLVNTIRGAARLNFIAGPLGFAPSFIQKILKAVGIADVAGLIRKIKEFVDEEIEKHKKDFDENDLRDFTDAFIKETIDPKRADNDVFSSENMAYILLNLFAAGTGTTAVSIRWGLLYLLHNPEVQAKFRQEIKNVIGFERPPSLNDKENMPYTTAFITEVLRCGSIAHIGVPHGSTKGFSYKGYDFPPGCVIFANLFSVNYDPDLFPEPMKFDPSRFLDHDGKLNGREKEIMTFSIGRRSCIGEPLARMEVFLFLASVVQRFELHPMENNPLPPAGFREPNEPPDYNFQAKAVKY